MIRSIGLFALCSLVLSTLLLSVPASARADRRADEREAREHYNKGMMHFDLGEIDDAVAEFKKAYTISSAPGLLFNIAQAYRTKKDYEQARHFYNSYLRLVPKAPNRADVEARLAEMEALIKEQERVAKERPVGIIPPANKEDEQAQEPAPATPKVEVPPPAVVAAPPPPPKFLSTTGGRATVALAALAGISAITAGALGGVALGARNDYRDGCAVGACNDATYDRAHNLAIGTDVLWGITAGAAVGALVVGLVTRSALHKPRAYAQGGLFSGSF